jgi:hypothetical protein
MNLGLRCRFARLARVTVVIAGLASLPRLAVSQSSPRAPIAIAPDSVTATVLGNHLSLAQHARDGGRCITEMNEIMLVRAAVSLQVGTTGVNDSAAARILPQAELLASAVADRVIRALGQSSGRLAAGEPRISWRSAGAYLQLIVTKRGNRIAIEPSGFQDDLAKLIAAAMQEELAADNPVFFPDGAPGDSTILRVSTAFPMVDEARRLFGTKPTKLFPLMTLSLPIERVPRQLTKPDVAYPAAGPLAEGMVIVRFSVDTTGRALAKGATDVWPMGVPRLRGESGVAYRRFIAKIVDGLEAARYEPARIGGCVVESPTVVQWNFGVRR